MFWKPSPIWQGQAAYLVGGGSSLRGFNFELLRGRNTIGANHAFGLGADIIKFVVFADKDWFDKVKHDLKKYTGEIVSLSTGLQDLNLPWIHKMNRVKDGLQMKDYDLGFNHSSGAIMINLAARLGANPIYLLGYDLSFDERKRSHWHAHYTAPSRPDSFIRFQRGFSILKQSMDRQRPDIKVINVINMTNGTSNLKLWPSITMGEFNSHLVSERMAA